MKGQIYVKLLANHSHCKISNIIMETFLRLAPMWFLYIMLY